MVHGKSMDNCSKILCLLQQNRKGIKVERIAKKLGIDRSTVYRQLEHLSNMGKATYREGIAYPTEKKEQPLPGSPEKYFHWRETPEGGGNRFFHAMFGDESLPEQPGIQTGKKPQSPPRKNMDRNLIPNPDEIDEINNNQR